MGEWTDSAVDVAELIEVDGDPATITTTAGTYDVQVFWIPKNIEGGEQDGPRAYVAAADLPVTLPQGSTFRYDGTDYTISVKIPDGHGLMELVLIDEADPS